MTYRTRHMVALKPIAAYFGDSIDVGQNFYATQIDGGYFVKAGRAADAPEPEIKPAEVPVVQPPVVDQSPPEPVQAEQQTAGDAKDPQEAQPSTAEPEEAAPVPVRRGPGRPRTRQG